VEIWEVVIVKSRKEGASLKIPRRGVAQTKKSGKMVLFTMTIKNDVENTKLLFRYATFIHEPRNSADVGHGANNGKFMNQK
jgi:hypothetical protein